MLAHPEPPAGQHSPGAMPAITRYHRVQIGKRTFPFTSFEQVSAAYKATIAALGLGGSQTPSCILLDSEGRRTGHVSYNGRVWRGDANDYFEHPDGLPCLFDPMPDHPFPPRRWADEAHRPANAGASS